MLGGTEYVAEACEEALQALGHQTKLHLQPDLAQISSENQTWLVCTSTHGAGDYPDNIQTFVADLGSKDLDLSSTKLLTLGIGDSSYDTFCLAATKITKTLKSKGCEQISPLITFDMSQDIDPEDLAQEWIKQIHDLL
jgi:MioC protein